MRLRPLLLCAFISGLGGIALPWDAHGFYEIALDAGSLSWHP